MLNANGDLERELKRSKAKNWASIMEIVEVEAGLDEKKASVDTTKRGLGGNSNEELVCAAVQEALRALGGVRNQPRDGNGTGRFANMVCHNCKKTGHPFYLCRAVCKLCNPNSNGHARKDCPKLKERNADPNSTGNNNARPTQQMPKTTTALTTMVVTLLR